jgi:hypothetical protein
VTANTFMIMLTIFISGLAELETRNSSSSDSQENDQGISSDSPNANTVDLLDQMYFITSALYFGVLVVLAAWHVNKLRQIGLVRVGADSLGRNSSMQMVLSTSLVFVIFLSRCVYDTNAAFTQGYHIKQDYNQDNMSSSDVFHVKLIPLTPFLLVLLWEVLPTSLVLVYFRKIPKNKQGPGAKLVTKFRACLRGCLGERFISEDIYDGENSSQGSASAQDLYEDEDAQEPLIHASMSPSGGIIKSSSYKNRLRSDSLTISASQIPQSNVKRNSQQHASMKSPSPSAEDSDTETRWKNAAHRSGSSDVGSGSYSIPNPILEAMSRFRNEQRASQSQFHHSNNYNNASAVENHYAA